MPRDLGFRPSPHCAAPAPPLGLSEPQWDALRSPASHVLGETDDGRADTKYSGSLTYWPRATEAMGCLSPPNAARARWPRVATYQAITTSANTQH